ncbi:MAG: hypothetical protein DMG58_05455 [Acidobacteria bacterium]|nr:MAG: hypothetical protein DMG58_05455 [Acidobacteriota bacterium]
MRISLLLLSASLAGAQPHNPLPARYYQLMEQGIARAEQRLAAEPSATLASLEAQPGWTHFPSATLAAAVLYTKAHLANSHRGDTKMLQLALKIGDSLAHEQEAGTYGTRLDHHRDTYMWLETYRLLEQDLGKERRERWRRAITVDIDEMAADTAYRQTAGLSALSVAVHRHIAQSLFAVGVHGLSGGKSFRQQRVGKTGSESAAPLRRRGAIARRVLGRAFERRSDHWIRLPDLHGHRRIL